MLDYKIEKFLVNLKTIKATFENYMPTDMKPYKLIYEQYANRNQFDVWEKSVQSGQGWIAVVCDNSLEADITIEGQYTTCIHKGEYSKLREIYQQIMIDYPSAKEFYNVYLNDPKITQPNNCLTMVVFK